MLDVYQAATSTHTNSLLPPPTGSEDWDPRTPDRNHLIVTVTGLRYISNNCTRNLHMLKLTALIKTSSLFTQLAWMTV